MKRLMALACGLVIILLPGPVLAAGKPFRALVEETTSGNGFDDSGKAFCTFKYRLSMEFEGQIGDLDAADLAACDAPPDEVTDAAQGQEPKLWLILRPLESSLKVISWQINDPENSQPPLPRFPKGPGGMGVSTNATLGWQVGDKVYLAYGFVGDGIYGFFADWDTDEEISRTQPQPLGCRPWYGGDDEVYTAPLAKLTSAQGFSLTRDFKSEDQGGTWKSQTALKIVFKPGP